MCGRGLAGQAKSESGAVALEEKADELGENGAREIW